MKRFILTCFTASLIAASFYSCKKCDCNTVTTTPITTEEVMIQNTAFNPSELTVARGTKVRWINHDPYAHTVTSNTNLFNSGNIDQGQVFEYTFTTTGTFDYHCNYHSVMKGRITVN